MNVQTGYLIVKMESMRKGSRSEDSSCPNALVRWLARPCAECAFLPDRYISYGLSSRPELLIPEGEERTRTRARHYVDSVYLVKGILLFSMQLIIVAC